MFCLSVTIRLPRCYSLCRSHIGKRNSISRIHKSTLWLAVNAEMLLTDCFFSSHYCSVNSKVLWSVGRRVSQQTCLSQGPYIDTGCSRIGNAIVNFVTRFKIILHTIWNILLLWRNADCLSSSSLYILCVFFAFFFFTGVRKWVCFLPASPVDWSNFWLQAARARGCQIPECVLLFDVWRSC